MKRYEFHERCEKFEEALERMEKKITDPNLAAAFHIDVWLEGTYFQYGHGLDKWFTSMCRKADRASQIGVKRYLKRVSRMASRYKVAALNKFDESGNFTTKALERKYMRRLTIG